MEKIFSNLVQLYITQACEMGCPHCSSVLQKMPNMSFRIFKEVIRVLEANGVSRVELFANDPLLHPQINDFIAILNKSKLEYAILTVGASPKNPEVKKRFLRVLDLINPKKGAFVFSVDYTKESAERILAGKDADISYAFKAKTFWDLAPLLQEKKVPVRINAVISRHNIEEVPEIIRRAIEMGFATSFCFAQHQQPEFKELLRAGLTSEAEEGFRSFLSDSDLLEEFQISMIMRGVRDIVATGQFHGPFNTFRGDDRSEAVIEPEKLATLRKELLNLKGEFGYSKVLPGREFISRLGNKGLGCLELLRQGQFPQLKIGSEGQIFFCCDLHDPLTQAYQIGDLADPDRQELFSAMVRTNPYIWLCAYFNKCDFSVNYVVYGARAIKFAPITKKDLPLVPTRIAEVNDFCKAQITATNLQVLGGIPDVLRADWLDSGLPEYTRANRHVHVKPDEWQGALEGVCQEVIQVCQIYHGKNTAALLMWRAALAFHKALYSNGVRPCHIDVKRNESTLEITEHMPLASADRDNLRYLAGSGQVLIPDPMLASGSSMSFTIDMLKDMGFKNNQIIIACVVAAPEGVFNLLNKYPGVKIIAATLDGCLNQHAYIIQKGLGDAGEKYFYGNSLSNFLRAMFTERQWAHLGHLLEMANK